MFAKPFKVISLSAFFRQNRASIILKKRAFPMQLKGEFYWDCICTPGEAATAIGDLATVIKTKKNEI